MWQLLVTHVSMPVKAIDPVAVLHDGVGVFPLYPALLPSGCCTPWPNRKLLVLAAHSSTQHEASPPLTTSLPLGPCRTPSHTKKIALLLQLENWVFESDKPDAELKLIDFGLSTYFGKVCCGCCTCGDVFGCLRVPQAGHGMRVAKPQQKYERTGTFLLARAQAQSTHVS